MTHVRETDIDNRLKVSKGFVAELAAGTCLRKFDAMGSGGDDMNKTRYYNPELPSDPHLLLYLFCSFLEHPRWMLHVDPTMLPSTHLENTRSTLVPYLRRRGFQINTLQCCPVPQVWSMEGLAFSVLASRDLQFSFFTGTRRCNFHCR